MSVIVSENADDTTELAQRLRALTGVRLAVTVLLGFVIATAGRELVETAGVSLLAGAAAILLTFNLPLALLLAPSRRRTKRWLRWSFELAALVDVFTIATLLAVTGGVVSPFVPLVHVEVVAVTLVLGFHAGARVAVLLSMAIVWLLSSGPISLGGVAAEAASAEPALGAALTPGIRAVLLLGSVWLAAVTVSRLSRVTENEMRRWLDDLELLREVTRELAPRNGIGNVSDALARMVLSAGDYRDVVVWLRESGNILEPASNASRAQRTETALGGCYLDHSDEQIARSVTAQTPVLVKRSDSRSDALIRAHGVEAPLVIMPLRVQGRLLGVVSATVTTPPLRAPQLRNYDLRRLRLLAEEAALLLDNARLQGELQSLAVTDGLTGLPNHRFFQQRLTEEVSREARRAADGDAHPLSVAMFDLDHFKHVNDAYGHPTGDAVLTAVGRTLEAVLRPADVACRYGGEEFALVLTDTDADGGFQACERIREAIAELELTTDDGQTLTVTASFGVATATGDSLDRSSLIAAADRALYAAKHAGRNRVVHADTLGDDTDGSVSATSLQAKPSR